MWTAKHRKAICGIPAVGLALALASAPAAAREQKVIQKRATAPVDPQTRGGDSYMDQAAPAAVHGTDTTFQVRSSTNANQRALLLFDLSAISNSGIKVATLSLFMSGAPSNNRTYEARRMIGLWKQAEVGWTNRQTGFAWATAGGDDSGAATTTTATGTTNNVTLNWTITPDVQQWFGAATPLANYGTVIRDNAESSGTARTATFSSSENATENNRPKLTIEFVQNVQGLTAVAGNSQVTLNWKYPATIGTVISATNGVLILRAPSAIATTVVPTDGTAYTRNAACTNLISGATVVFSSNTLPVKFDDSAAGNNADCPPVNGTPYSYKVFTKDAANNYSHSGASSQFVPFALATPGATASAQQAATWVAPTGSTTLAAPGIIPNSVVVLATTSNIANGVNPVDGSPVFTPVTTDGGVTGRPPILESPDASIAKNATYLADSNGFVYALDTANGNTLWVTNPSGAVANAFPGGTAAFVKKFGTASYTRATDLVIAGTRNTATTTGNRVVGLDGNDGTTAWTLLGNNGGTPSMDIVASTPFVDYVNNAIWVTSNSNGTTTQPSLWKINPNNTGTRLLASANLNDISNSPSMTQSGDVLFVGNDIGTLYAVSPAITGTNAPTLANFPAGDTQVTGSPLILSFASPYKVIFSGATTVKAVLFNKATNTFTTTGAGTWTITMPGTTPCTPSAPVGFAGLSKVYVGCTDGNVYQIDVASGTIDGTRLLRANNAIGDPTLDVVLNLLIVACANSRVYALKYPF